MLSPTVKHTIKPGPAVAAIPSISFRETLLSSRAASIIYSIFSKCALAANSGTTPPNFLCSEIWLETIFDKISAELTTWRNLPDIRFLSSYHDDKNYIDACVNRIETYWGKKGKSNQLIFSFHGLPQINLLKGDPYHCYCQKTARLIAEKLNISKN